MNNLGGDTAPARTPNANDELLDAKRSINAIGENSTTRDKTQNPDGDASSGSGVAAGGVLANGSADRAESSQSTEVEGND